MDKLIQNNIKDGTKILLIISLISSILIIILKLLYKNLCTLTHQLSLIIAISELLFNIVPQLFGLSNKIKNIFVIFSDCLTLLMLLQFSIGIYNLFYTNQNLKTYKLYFVLISILYSFILNLISSEYDKEELRLNLFIKEKKLISIIHSLSMTIISLINFFIIHKTTKHIYKLSKNDNVNGWKVFSIINDLTNYPFIGMINWIFLWIGFFLSFFPGNPRIIGIFYSLNEITLCLRCFLLLLLFITSQKVIENIKTTINFLLKPMNIKFEFETQY